MADLTSALASMRQSVGAFAVAAEAAAPRWHTPRASGKWSPAQVTEHVTRALEVNRQVLHGDAPGRPLPRFLRPLLRWFGLNPVLRKHRFIRGSKSPRIFRPSEQPEPPAVLIPRLRAAADTFERDADSAPGAIDHPFFGRLPLTDFVELQTIHTDHHRAQLGLETGELRPRP